MTLIELRAQINQQQSADALRDALNAQRKQATILRRLQRLGITREDGWVTETADLTAAGQVRISHPHLPHSITVYFGFADYDDLWTNRLETPITNLAQILNCMEK